MFGLAKRAAVCAATIGFGSVAHANTLTIDVPLLGLGSETIGGFDPAAGTLTQAEITISGSISNTFVIETEGEAFDETYSAGFRIEGPFGMVAAAADSVTVQCEFGRFCSETRVLDASATDSRTFTDPVDLAALIGTPFLFEVVSADGGSFAGSVSVTYAFTPSAVPLPAGLPLLLGGLGALGLIRRRTRIGSEP